MDVVLKQSGNRIGVYIDKKLVTIFENMSVEQVVQKLEKTLKYVKIHIKQGEKYI